MGNRYFQAWIPVFVNWIVHPIPKNVLKFCLVTIVCLSTHLNLLHLYTNNIIQHQLCLGQLQRTNNVTRREFGYNTVALVTYSTSNDQFAKAPYVIVTELSWHILSSIAMALYIYWTTYLTFFNKGSVISARPMGALVVKVCLLPLYLLHYKSYLLKFSVEVWTLEWVSCVVSSGAIQFFNIFFLSAF